MAALVAQELEIAFLEALDNEELVVVPLVSVFLEELGEALEASPLHRNPLEFLLLSERVILDVVLNGQFPVNIIFDLLDGRVTLLLLRCTCRLLS